MESLPALAQQRISLAIKKRECRLNLARCGLKDSHLAQIDWLSLSFVRSIDLSGNSLCTIARCVFEQFGLVEELSLYKNQITELPQGMMACMRRCHS